MLSFIEMKLLNDKANKENKGARIRKMEIEHYRLAKERSERRKARKDKRDAKTMPEHLRRYTRHLKKEILHDINSGYLRLNHDIKIDNSDKYTEHRYFLGKAVATSKPYSFSNTPVVDLKPSWGYDRTIKSVVALAYYYKMKTRDLMNNILHDIGEDIGLKITLGDYTTEWHTYVHIEIRND